MLSTISRKWNNSVYIVLSPRYPFSLPLHAFPGRKYTLRPDNLYSSFPHRSTCVQSLPILLPATTLSSSAITTKRSLLHHYMLIWLNPPTLHRTDNSMHRHDLSSLAEGISKIGAHAGVSFSRRVPLWLSEPKTSLLEPSFTAGEWSSLQKA